MRLGTNRLTRVPDVGLAFLEGIPVRRHQHLPRRLGRVVYPGEPWGLGVNHDVIAFLVLAPEGFRRRGRATSA